ncbi:hypothetical protein [Azospirillum sp. ST 5-10]|uniref:hypothetical protein n=1 Tax=unclassified Azospirillum TaxID=2630922 RepID=UPI003F49F40D
MVTFTTLPFRSGQRRCASATVPHRDDAPTESRSARLETFGELIALDIGMIKPLPPHAAAFRMQSGQENIPLL